MELNLNTTSKAAMLEMINKLEAERDTMNSAATNAIAIANLFGTHLATIEEAMKPLMNKKNLLTYVLFNLKEVIALVVLIITRIKEWRAQLNEINNPPKQDKQEE